TGGTADRNRSHWSTSKTPSYTKSVSWQHHHILLLHNIAFFILFIHPHRKRIHFICTLNAYGLVITP
ncbi:hypothetical protein, partial [Shigella sonnei]|uniref:hypothetical protein n=1 Tax=Shigella sonnei TaxID=624 RepID=UPI001C0A7CDD